jgi:hypothetical protein
VPVAIDIAARRRILLDVLVIAIVPPRRVAATSLSPKIKS